MLRSTRCICGGQRKWWREGNPQFERANARRRHLEARRIEESQLVPPVEPSPQEACRLYRQLLKQGYAKLKLTEKEYYKRKLRCEFEVTSRQTSARVRGIMYEKGLWMSANHLGGLM